MCLFVFYTRLEAPKSHLHVSTYLQCFYVERICKTPRRPTLRSRSETARDCFFGVSDEFCCLFPDLPSVSGKVTLFGSGAGVFVQVVPHISDPPAPRECSPLINVPLSLLKTEFQSKSNRIPGICGVLEPNCAIPSVILSLHKSRGPRLGRLCIYCTYVCAKKE